MALFIWFLAFPFRPNNSFCCLEHQIIPTLVLMPIRIHNIFCLRILSVPPDFFVLDFCISILKFSHLIFGVSKFPFEFSRLFNAAQRLEKYKFCLILFIYFFLIIHYLKFCFRSFLHFSVITPHYSTVGFVSAFFPLCKHSLVWSIVIYNIYIVIR